MSAEQSSAENSSAEISPRSSRTTWWLSAAAGTTVIVGLFALVKLSGLPAAKAQAPQPRPLASPVKPGQAPAYRPAAPAAPNYQPRVAAAPNQYEPAAKTPVAPPKDMKVVAIVNGEQISRQQLGDECLKRFGKEVIDGMINRQLIAQACEEHKIVVAETEIDAEIEKMAKRFKLSVDRWLELLKEERGFAPEEYRREVIWPMLAMRKLTAGKLAVSDQELREAYEAEYGPRVRVRLIDVSKKEDALAIRGQAVANPDAFASLAKNKSEDKAVASANGVVPPIRKHMGNKEFEDAVFKLKPGEISQVLPVGNKYLIVKCEEQLPATVIPGEHMAEVDRQLTERIKEQKLRSAAGDLFKQFQDKAQVVHVLKDPKLQAQYPGVAASVNGKPISLQQLAEECILRHGRDVLDGEINRRLLAQELTKMKQTVTDADLDAETARAAEMYGYTTQDGKPDVQRWLKDVTDRDGATVDLYRKDAVWPSVALKKLVVEPKVTDDDLKKGFESNYGEKVEVLAVVCSDQRQAQKVWDMARSNPTDAFFAKLAEQYSIEPMSRSQGGKVPPIRKHSGQGKLEEEAFKLQAGELSSVVAAGGNFILMRCLGRTKPENVKFDVVKGELYKDLHEQKLRVEMTKRFDGLKDNSRIENFLANTIQMPKKQTVSDKGPGGPPGMLPGDTRTSAAPSGVKAAPVSATRQK